MRSILVLLALIAASVRSAQDAPSFRPDPSWPKPFPGNSILRRGRGPRHRSQRPHLDRPPPKSLLDDEKGATHNAATKCCTAAPPVMEFDADGNLLRSWGGFGQGYDWPQNEHGRTRTAASGRRQQQGGPPHPEVRAYGKFLMQIGKPGFERRIELADPARPSPRTWSVDDAAGELYVADGYLNRGLSYSTPRPERTSATGGRTAPRRRSTTSFRPTARLHRCRRASATPCTACGCRTTAWSIVSDRVNDRIQVFRKDGAFVGSSSASIRKPWRTARFGTWCCRAIRAEVHLRGGRCQWPDQCAVARGRGRCFRSGAVTAASPAN